MAKSIFGLAAGIGQITIIGMIFLVNADYFFNPVNGLFRALSFFNEDAMVIPRIKLDDLTCWSLSSYGVGAVSIGGMHLLAGEDRLLKKECLRGRMWLAALACHVFIHAAFVYDLVGINKVACAFWGGLTFVNFLWALSESLRHFQKPDLIPRTKPTRTEFLTLAVCCVFTGLWAVPLLWAPRIFEPAAGNPMGMLQATPKDDNTFMDIHLLTTRLEGVPMMACTLCMLELILLDRSVEAIRANNKFALVCCMLYTLHMLRFAFFGGDLPDKTAIAINTLINGALSVFFVECGPKLFKEEPAKVLAEHAKEVLQKDGFKGVQPKKVK
jgi:hypothetical protein